MNPQWSRIAGGAVMVGVCVCAGFAMHSRLDPARVPTAAGSRASSAGVRVPAGEASLPSADPLDSLPETRSDFAPKIPEQLPEFSLSDAAGKPTRVSTWRGKSLILNFWATWCAPCRRKIPLLETLYGEWSGHGIEVVGIAVDHPDKVRAFAKEMKIAYPLLVGEQDALDVATALGAPSPAFPFTVFTDQRGRVVTLYVGELHRPDANLILSVVRDLNLNLVQLPEARRTIAAGLEKLRNDRGV